MLPFLERAPDGQRFAHAFQLRGEHEWWPCASTVREFLEGKGRDRGNDAVEAGEP
jgi:hypothetical protein